MLESLPNYDWLVETPYSIIGLGTQNEFHEYVHKPENIDHEELEFDLPTCTNYPLLSKEPTLDLSQIQVNDPSLEPFIHQQLKEHYEVIATNEWDSGRIPNYKFEINLIDEKHPLKEGFLSKEYWMKEDHKKEIRRQLAGMVKAEIIEDCTNPLYVSSLFCVPKKTGDVRIVFDYRKLNLITRKLLFPIKLKNYFQIKRQTIHLSLI